MIRRFEKIKNFVRPEPPTPTVAPKHVNPAPKSGAFRDDHWETVAKSESRRAATNLDKYFKECAAKQKAWAELAELEKRVERNKIARRKYRAKVNKDFDAYYEELLQQLTDEHQQRISDFKKIKAFHKFSNDPERRVNEVIDLSVKRTDQLTARIDELEAALLPFANAESVHDLTENDLPAANAALQEDRLNIHLEPIPCPK